jgi:hypothetical protein
VSDLAHELGHNLGLSHSHSINCGAVAYDPNTECSVLEYGDLFSTMGRGDNYAIPPHYEAVSKEFLGWVAPVSVTASGIYNVAPWEKAPGQLPVALKIMPLLGNGAFYIEYRQPIGFDSSFTLNGVTFTQAYDGALFHMPLPNGFKQILNMNPTSYSVNGPTTPALAVGGHYVDYANRFAVTTVSATASALQLRILVPGINSPTLLFVTPSNSSTAVGTVVISVDALDRTGVSKVELYRDGTLLGTKTSAPYQFSWDTTKEISGNHTLMGKAYNALGNTYSQTIAVTVNSGVSGPVPQVSGVAPATGLLATSSIAPGSLVSIYGSALAGQQAQASIVPLPNALGNVSVTYNGIPAPLIFVTGNQINAQVPWNNARWRRHVGNGQPGSERTWVIEQSVPNAAGRTVLPRYFHAAIRRRPGCSVQQQRWRSRGTGRDSSWTGHASGCCR